MTPSDSLKQPVSVYRLIRKKTVNNLFSQTIFNHPFKYLCRRPSRVPPSFRIWDGQKQQEDNNNKNNTKKKEKKGEARPGEKKKKKDQQIGEAWRQNSLRMNAANPDLG